MRTPTRLSFALSSCLLLGLAFGGCSSLAGNGKKAPPPPVLTGVVERSEIEADVPAWVGLATDAEIDSDVAQALSGVEPGATLDVFFGTWCGDSRRELSRFWRVLDETGSLVPFDIQWIAVDRTKKEPVAQVGGVDLLYVPTFIVRRDGQEIGRIVESSPGGLETDLLSLLDGSATGLITAKPELLGEATEP